jgi:hypothetical protein
MMVGSPEPLTSDQMTKLFYLLMFIICCFSCKRNPNRAEVDSDHERWKIKELKPGGVETETDHNGVIIQNSFPRGDGYRDSKGKVYPVAIFWTRIINHGEKPIALSIDFKADSLVNPAMGDLRSTLFLLPDTMTLDKDQLYGYGITDLRSVLDNRANIMTRLRRTILPNQEYMFRVGMYSYSIGISASKPRDYVLRSGLAFKEEDLLYIIRANSDSTFVPFGKIFFTD